MNLLKFLPMLPVFIAIVRQAVQIVEEVKDGWTPEEARAQAMTIVKILSESLGISLPKFITDRLGSVIDAMVAVLNAIGVFQKSAPGPLPTIPRAEGDEGNA